MVKGKIQLCSLFAVLLSSPRYFAFMHKSWLCSCSESSSEQSVNEYSKSLSDSSPVELSSSSFWPSYPIRFI